MRERPPGVAPGHRDFDEPFGPDEEDEEVDVDFDEPLEEESEPVEVEEEPVPTAKKESKSKRKPRKKEAKEKVTEPKEVTVSHPVPATALDLISAALDLRKNQIAEAKLTPDAKEAAMEQIDYAKQVISLFLYG